MGSYNRKLRRQQPNTTVFPSQSSPIERVVFHDEGRTIHLTRSGGDEMRSGIEGIKSEFRDQFGRDMQPGDPLFWDPAGSEPAPMDEEALVEMLAEAMEKTGFSADYVYAYRKCGVVVTQENQELIDPDDLAAFFAAMDEYNAANA